MIAFNLSRVAAALTDTIVAEASTGSIRRRLITVPARIATSARRITLHLPLAWHQAWHALYQRAWRSTRPNSPLTTGHTARQHPPWDAQDSEIRGTATPNRRKSSTPEAKINSRPDRWIRA